MNKRFSDWINWLLNKLFPQRIIPIGTLFADVIVNKKMSEWMEDWNIWMQDWTNDRQKNNEGMNEWFHELNPY
jgi:hypothetical protein